MDGKMMEEEFERDSEAGAEAEAEAEEAMGTEEVEETGAMEASAMEVDGDGKSEVVAMEEERKSGGRKQTLSSLPKASRKRQRTVTAMQSQVGSQPKARSTGSMETLCEQCVHQGVVCMVVDGGQIARQNITSAHWSW